MPVSFRIVFVSLLWCSASGLHMSSGEPHNPPHFLQQQFPAGSEALEMPRTVLFSIFMGPVSYEYINYTVASMAPNKNIDFVIINIDGGDGGGLAKAAKKYNLPNLIIQHQTMEQWHDRVKERLGIDVPFTKDWYYKMCDYKPTLAHLFPELVDSQKYKWWGFADLDLVWGNFQHFAHLFQGQFPIVESGWVHTTGALLVMKNEEWSKRLFMEDPLYIPLLRNQTYHNIDEMGIQCAEENIVDGGQHSMNSIIARKVAKTGWKRRRGEREHDLFHDAGDVESWAGPVLWQDGSLKTQEANEFYPAGRELFFFHVRRPEGHNQVPEDPMIVEDGLAHGYLLPTWKPVAA